MKVKNSDISTRHNLTKMAGIPRPFFNTELHISKIIWQSLVFQAIFCYAMCMKRIIQVSIYKGSKYYTAEGIDVPIVTQGKTLDELVKNVSEAIELYLENESLTDLNLAPDPSILLNFELPTHIHA